MLALTQVVPSFPTVRLPGAGDGPPVEVSLIAQLGIGAGDQLYAGATARQSAHANFVDELDEPSTQLAGIDLTRGDATSLYSFAVGAKGHPFHRHAGHRVFTAISGSGGAQLRFSSASNADIARDPHSFLRALRCIDIPPDSLFTVRFAGETWHQFAPRDRSGTHPVLFALSCHTNELGGNLPTELRARVAAGDATIPALTELLPPAVSALLQHAGYDPAQAPTVALSLYAPTTSLQGTVCRRLRSLLGRVRGWLRQRRASHGFLSDSGSGYPITMQALPTNSLLAREFTGGCDHSDSFALDIPAGQARADSASAWLSALLQGFLDNRPVGVTRLMRLRNTLVRPLGLRTSPLGCPVSSLLCTTPSQRFAARYPVLAETVSADDRCAEVLLGADDKHLRFRSSVRAELRDDGSLRLSLSTRVQCRNAFGRFYMASIDRVHRHYIAPAMLQLAAAWALRSRA
ncbi:MAG: DUF2867 domain-containing protein [Rhodanobacteraceae bacterium]|nr:DUF2867 domain-containing protein [Rhodanobacteraceae bacterium]